jgi:hypothetical protein
MKLLPFTLTSNSVKSIESPGSDQILAELIQQEVQHYSVRFVNSLILFGVRSNCLSSGMSLLLYKYIRGAIKLNSSNYQGISLFSTTCKILSYILLSRLSPYIDEIIGDNKCKFHCNRSNTVQIFCIHQIQEKKWDYPYYLNESPAPYLTITREQIVKLHIA